jgi:GDPmannose 4,6-dehydratase
MGKSLIFGINGQDGHYLGPLLESKGQVVFGAGRRRNSAHTNHFECDISDKASVGAVLARVRPDEIYNLAGISSPVENEAHPGLAYNVNVKGVGNIISAMGEHCPDARLLQASSGYIFSPGAERKSEQSKFGPTGAYGKHKLEAHMLVCDARKRGLFAANGILFNHESPMRSPEFVTRKVTQAAAEFKQGRRTSALPMGDLEAVRDWGFAGDYVEAMQLMLAAPLPKDYVIATGKGHSVAQLCEEAFSRVGLDYKHHIFQDKALVRKDGPDTLVGDPSLIRKDLNWFAKMPFREMVRMMVDHDLSQGA